MHPHRPEGYIDTQSGYQCQAVANSKDGEPATNIAISKSTNVHVVNCSFSHLGAVYALGADGASQSVIVSNNEFHDLSGGSLKLGKSGERGAPAPDPATPVPQQDRGYLVADNLMTASPSPSQPRPSQPRPSQPRARRNRAPVAHARARVRVHARTHAHTRAHTRTHAHTRVRVRVIACARTRFPPATTSKPRQTGRPRAAAPHMGGSAAARLHCGSHHC